MADLWGAVVGQDVQLMNLDLILEMDLEQGCYQCLFGRRVSGWVVQE